MGSGVSLGVRTAVEKAAPEELEAALRGLDSEQRARLKAALAQSCTTGSVASQPPPSAEPPSAELRYVKKKVSVKVGGVERQMAYIEVGEGDPLVFLHGNPTSSYMWRNVLPHCESLGRLVAPDLIGMGDSDKLESPTEDGPDHEGRYSVPQQSAFLDAFLAAVGVERNVTFVFHSWGAVLGSHWAQRHRDRVKGLVVMECVFTPFPSWDAVPEKLRGGFQMMRTEKGAALILEKNVMIESGIPSNVLRGLSPEEMAEYRRPFVEPGESRRPILSFVRAVPVAGEPAEVHAMMESSLEWLRTAAVPKLFVNGDPGSSMDPSERDLVRGWPQTQEVTVKGSHLLPEDSPVEIGQAIADWYRGLG